MSELTKKFYEIDALIREAQWKKASEILWTLKMRKASEAELIQFASMARRCNLSQLALSMLRPFVRPLGRRKAEASDAMKAEYAANLVCVGIFVEATKIFETISLKRVPEAYQMRAILHMRNWDYRAAIPLLEKHLQNPDLSDYRTLVGKLNLAMCHLHEEEYTPAIELLNTVLTYDGTLTKLLRGNALRLYGNLEYQRGDYEKAVQYLQLARVVFEKPSSPDSFYTEKWLTLCRYALDRSTSNLLEIQNMIQRAKLFRDWETVRDFDFEMACLTQDEHLLVKLYYGTPNEEYRLRIVKKFPKLIIPSNYHWKVAGDLVSSEDLEKLFSLRDLGLKPGQAHHRFLSTLLSDFYRPLSVLDFHEKVFAGSYYNQGHSEQIVYKALNRLRAWMARQRLPLKVESSDNVFFLRATAPCAVVLELEKGTQSRNSYRLMKLSQALEGKWFSAQEAMQVLDLSRRSINYVLKEAMATSQVVVRGKTANRRYLFTIDPSKKVA